jgi:fermentation-respiration switch protein FrsA (DUF1100 family)
MLLPAGGCSALTATPGSRGLSLEEAIVFAPRPYPRGDWRADGPGVEDAWFESPDGLRLHGWFAEAREPRAVVLYAHGNAGNVTDRRHALHLFRDQLAASVLVFDYRGYGRSQGVPTETGVLADARAARRWLADRCGVPEGEIVLVGNSLGGGVAVDLAVQDGARGLVLENTFTSLPDVAASHVRLFPAWWVMGTRLDSLAKIPRYRGPLLQTHGDADEVVPFGLGEKLFAVANEPKRFVRVRGGRHNDPPAPEYVAALDEFLGSLPARGGRSQP